ncbi:MAG: radical SAM protein, partial [Lachnospiraceae bacterium]
RNVYVWGTGNKAHTFFHEFIEKNPKVRIAGCIDSNQDNAGKNFFRRRVYTPEMIDTEGNAFYIIATTDYYGEIRDYLVRHGKKENIDFVHYLAINHYASWMMRETVFDIPRLDYVCPKPFHDVELIEEGRIMSCVGIPGNPVWTVPTYYSNFYDVWHSNAMKVLRLSVVNGTYTFCNKKKCDILDDCGRQEIDVNELHYHLHRSKQQIKLISEKSALPQNTIFHVSSYDIKPGEYPDVVMCGYDKTCNLHCPSCRESVYVAQGKEKEKLLNYTNRMKKELFEKVKYIKVSGTGEAFASDVCKDIIFDKRISEKVKRVGILSNGTLFTKEKVDRLLQMYDEVKVFISMDGAEKETAEKLRAGVNFENWKKNMEYIGEMRKNGDIKFLAFNFVVQRDNYKEMPDFVRMCQGFHADEIKFSRLFNWGKFTQEEYNKISMFSENDEMLDELKEVVKDPIFSKPEVQLFRWVNW